MAALRPQKRRMTAKAAAELYDISERTIRNIVAQPRSDYRAEQKARREAIRVAHDDEGLTWPEVAKRFKISEITATQLGKRARKERAEERAKEGLSPEKLKATWAETKRHEGLARRKRVAGLHMEGFTYKQIAAELGLAESSIGAIVWRARKEGLMPPAKPAKKKLANE